MEHRPYIIAWWRGRNLPKVAHPVAGLPPPERGKGFWVLPCEPLTCETSWLSPAALAVLRERVPGPDPFHWVYVA